MTRIRSYNHQTDCGNVTRVLRPRTLDEARDAVRSSTSTRERVKAVGGMHSANSQICSDGLVVRTDRLRAIIGLEEFRGEETVVVEAGVELGQLADWLHERGKALGFAFPNFRRVTIGGAVSTGAHGSSWAHDAIISSLVRELVAVAPDGSARVYDAEGTPPELWKALKVGLGALGLIVRLRLKVVDQFNVEITTSFMNEDAVITAAGAVTWLERCDYDQYVWFPMARTMMRVGGQISREPAMRDARNTLLIAEMSWPSFRTHGWMLNVGRRSSTVNRIIERRRYTNFEKRPPFEVRDDTGHWQPATCVVGPSHLMLISDLPKRERYYRMSDWEFAIPIERADAAIAFMREYLRAHRLALPLFGVVLRFAPCHDDTWIGHTVAQGAFQSVAVLADFLVYEINGRQAKPGLGVDDVWTTLAKALMTRFGARPHWGKNQDWVFPFASKQGVYGPNLERFADQVRLMDPHGAFANGFSDRLFAARALR